MIDNPRSADSRLRKEVLERDGYKCRYCGSTQEPFHIDHVYPYSLGGETSTKNLVTACSVCNQKKHNKIGIWPKPIGYFDRNYHIRLHVISVWGIYFIVIGLLSVILDKVLESMQPIGWIFSCLGIALLILGILFSLARAYKESKL